MAKTLIISEDTMASLLEAHASMAAWYYQFSHALRESSVEVEQPSVEQRLAYLAQLGSHFPEISTVAGGISSPRLYVPPPIIATPAQVTENEGIEAAPPPPPAEISGPAPPPVVDPTKVKY